MNNALELAHNKFIAGLGQMSSAFGLNRFVAQLYALLYLSSKPLSLDEIAQALGVSKGNVSINIRELEKWGAVRNVWVKGSRKDYYQAEPDVKRVFLNKVKSAIQKRTGELSNLIEEFGQILASMDGKLSEEETQVVAVYTERLQNLKEVKDTVVSLLKIYNL